jgi:energy-coupling factor transporter ATP-binding protein EcfA2
MKIVMIGNTGVGKTTYMASLYGILQQKIGGFSLQAVNQQDHHNWLDLAKDIPRSRYPSKTSQRGEYDFLLQHQGKEIFTFRWADYRGGAIKEESSSQQAQSLIKDLREADGILMFCDSEAMTKKNIKAEIRRMTVLLTQALQDIEKPICLSIILSKADSIIRFDEQLITPFEQLITIINASEWAMGAFIPVACSHYFMNVSLPLLFALYGGAYVQAAVTAHIAEQSYNQAVARYKQSQTFGGGLQWIADKWNGEKTQEEIAIEEYNRSMELAQKYEYIKDPVLALNQYIQHIPTIESSKNIKDYTNACANLKMYEKLSGLGNKDPFAAF